MSSPSITVNSPNDRQQGIATLLLVITLGLVIMAVITVIAASTYSLNAPEVTVRQQHYLEHAIQQVANFYKENAWYLSQGNQFPLSPTELFTDAGIAREYNVQACISNQEKFGSHSIPYYNIWLYTPSQGGGDEPTCVDGVFTQNDAQAVVEYSGEEAQSQLLAATEKKMDTLGSLLVQASGAAIEGGPTHDVDVDYLAAAACNPSDAGTIACSSNWNNISGSGMSQLIGTTSGFAESDWGQPITYSNEAPNDSNIEPPFTISLRTELPGGAYLTKTFTQPDA